MYMYVKTVRGNARHVDHEVLDKRVDVYFMLDDRRPWITTFNMMRIKILKAFGLI
jgi:hypothetical protein